MTTLSTSKSEHRHSSPDEELYLPCGRCGKLRTFNDSPAEDKNSEAPRSCRDCGHRVILGESDDTARVIDEFVVIDELGRGGAATVYLATQTSLDRPVALKIGHSPDAKEVKALLSEARRAAKVSHPGLAQVYKFGTWNGLWFMAMEFIDGPNLKSEVANNGPLNWRQALKVALQVACGLEVVWTEIGLVHRDIKPENILLPTVGHAKLVDLGLAVSSLTPTDPEALAGTPHFMSPEQFKGQPLDVRSDIYALGATLYYILTGHLPYDGKNPVELGRKHMTAPVPNVNDHVDVPEAVNELVRRMMAKKCDSRYSIFVLINVLKALIATGDVHDDEEEEEEEDVEEPGDHIAVPQTKRGKPGKKMKASKILQRKKGTSRKVKPDTGKVRLPGKKPGTAKLKRKR